MTQESLKRDISKRFSISLMVSGTDLITTLDEDDYFEFKKSLHAGKSGISKMYLKTAAGFANNKGGVIIFGVDPNTQALLGIKKEFEGFDNKLVTAIFSQFLDGINSYFFFTEYFTDKLIGFLCINQPSIKPVIVKNSYNFDGTTYNAGDIYFRYPGEVRKILPSDLREMMTTEVNRHANRLISQMERLVAIGPSNAAIIDSSTGEIDANGAKLSLSPELLSGLNLIMEGQFVEKEGAPAYVIKGDIELDSKEGGKSIITRDVLKTLHNKDYHIHMLTNDGTTALHFLENIVFMDTPFLPVYFYIEQAKISLNKTIELIENKTGSDVRKNPKNKLLERLKSPEDFYHKSRIGSLVDEMTEDDLEDERHIESLRKKYCLHNNRQKSIVRTVIYNRLNTQKPIHNFLFKSYLNELIEAFTHVDNSEIRNFSDFYKAEMLKVLDVIQEGKTIPPNVKTSLRKASSRLDYIIHGEDFYKTKKRKVKVENIEEPTKKSNEKD